MSTTTALPAPDFEAARAARRDDDFLEADGPSVHLPAEIADALLSARGWTFEPVSGGTAYVLPGGKRRADGGKMGTDYLWHRDDALHLALTAEGLAAKAGR